MFIKILKSKYINLILLASILAITVAPFVQTMEIFDFLNIFKKCFPGNETEENKQI